MVEESRFWSSLCMSVKWVTPACRCWTEVVEGQIRCSMHRGRSTRRHPGVSSVRGTQRLSRRSASPRTGSSVRAGTCLLLIPGTFTRRSINAVMGGEGRRVGGTRWPSRDRTCMGPWAAGHDVQITDGMENLSESQERARHSRLRAAWRGRCWARDSTQNRVLGFRARRALGWSLYTPVFRILP